MDAGEPKGEPEGGGVGRAAKAPWSAPAAFPKSRRIAEARAGLVAVDARAHRAAPSLILAVRIESLSCQGAPR